MHAVNLSLLQQEHVEIVGYSRSGPEGVMARQKKTVGNGGANLGFEAALWQTAGGLF